MSNLGPPRQSTSTLIPISSYIMTTRPCHYSSSLVMVLNIMVATMLYKRVATRAVTVEMDVGDFVGEAIFSVRCSTSKIKWLFYDAADKKLHDTTCTSDAEQVPIDIGPNTSPLRIEVIPNCDQTSSTAWNFSLQCPGLTTGDFEFVLSKIVGPDADPFDVDTLAGDTGIEHTPNSPGYVVRESVDHSGSESALTQDKPNTTVTSTAFKTFPRVIRLGQAFSFNVARRIRVDRHSNVGCTDASEKAVGCTTSALNLVAR